MRKGPAAGMAALAAAVLALSALADTAPIYVDGTGLGDDHIIDPSTITVDTPVTTVDTPTTVTTDTTTQTTGGEVVFTPVPDDYGTQDEAEPDPNAVPKWYYEPTDLVAEWRGQTGEVLSLGSVVTVLKIGRETVEVYTREITFPLSEGETELAVIRAPKSGRISMFKRPNGKSAIIMKCATCAIVPVYARTKRYALIHYEDAVGYVNASALDKLEIEQGSGDFAYVAVNGKPLYNDTVNVRQNGVNGSRILKDFPCGQRVAVISVSEDDKWTEIEAQGLRCFILSKFLTVVPESEAAELPVKGIGSKTHANAEAEAPAATPAPPQELVLRMEPAEEEAGDQL